MKNIEMYGHKRTDKDHNSGYFCTQTKYYESSEMLTQILQQNSSK